MSSESGEDTILVIDDEEGIRVGSQRILTRMGCQAVTASRGDEGLATLQKEKISIVLLDLKMPGMDGFEVLAQIRKHHPNILVIIITGFATVEAATEALKQGAYDFIPKPFEPDQLRIVIGRALEKQRLRREAEKLEREKNMTLADLGKEKSRLRTILESLPNGVLVTNADGQVVLNNPAWRRQLGLSADLPHGVPIKDCLSDEGLIDLAIEISQGCFVDFEEIPVYEFSPTEQEFLLARGRPILGEKNECLGAVITIEDITGMKVLDRLKTEFVAKVTHELRSPLATIHEQLATVLRDNFSGDAGQDQYVLSRAKEKTMGLISLIGDLLDLSRIESGKISKEVKPVHMDELLADVISFLNARAEAKKQALTFKAPPEKLPPITADPMALESIFGNLISNAIQYSPENGKILVKAEQVGKNLRVSVQDNGFGIDAKYHDKIFDNFYRVKNENTRYITGTGLGLPIVKGLVTSLGGSIFLESEPNQGTTFTVLLPID